MILLALAAATVLAAAPAAAAQWELSETPLSPSDENASLGVSGRNVAVDAANRVHLLFQKNLGGDSYQIFHTVREPDGGWSPAEQISPVGETARNAVAVFDKDGRLHTFWQRSSSGAEDIGYRVREPDGTWGDPATVAPAPNFSRFPVAVVDAYNRVHLVWVDGRDNKQQILHTAKDAAGDVWDPVRVLSGGGVIPDEPTLDADGLGSVYVAWSDRGAPNQTRLTYDILYVVLVPGGPIAPVRLIETGGVSISPYLEVMEDGTVHLVWLDDRVGAAYNYSEIYYKRFLPGIGWGNDKRFSYDGSDHDRPIIVAGPDQTLNLAWEDYRNESPDIYYRQITDEFGWDPAATRLTADVSASVSPSLVALPDGKLILIWSDAQGTGTFRIHAKEGTVR
jgi:hypothetical protein